MHEHRITLLLTPEEITSLEATVNELVSSWTQATPTLLSKLRMEVSRVKYTAAKKAGQKIKIKTK